ncbi:MAG TPA: PQQ-binding-like beta-propeller repeat protein [Opitutaceae bacterium]|nr:PQQ-binding-like beta-propeller repeat protein [Lacunisphaera sp.]HWA09091.1 PQQ-binding-like beta-propeller repeat protein [Opitutaceae bacterium]
MSAFAELPSARRLPSAIVLGLLCFLPALRAQEAPLPWEQRLQLRQAPPPPPPPAQFLQICALCHGNDARGTDRAVGLVNSPDLRSLGTAAIADIIRKGKGQMPPFSLPAADIQTLATYVRALNSTALALMPGDPKAGEAIFFGSGRCSTCHLAESRGSSLGPDLSDVAEKLTAEELVLALLTPGARITPGYESVTVTLNDGRKLQGFARARGDHDLVLQTDDGRLHVMLDTEYQSVTTDPKATMPAFAGTANERRDLLAFLSRLEGVGSGPLKSPQPPVSTAETDAIVHPKPGDWPTYNGVVGGNRHSSLDQVNLTNVGKLQQQWLYPIPFGSLETTPLVIDGVMYVTGNNQVYALSGKSGREIWRYQRPKSPSSMIPGDAAIGVNRGAAVLGDRIFYATDNAHLLALDRLTGALLWDVTTPPADAPGHYGSTAAPLVANGLVVTGVSGGDNGIRGFVAAYNPTNGELVWRLWTIPQPGQPGPGAETWRGKALEEGGGATWLTGAYDAEANVIYWAVGNPHPDTNGDDRGGANLFTNCDLAIDAKTGRMLWHYQFTPHDVHDWDANQPIVLADAKWQGQDRKLLLHANRNGFLYVLDRVTGTPLLASRMVDKLTWATGIDPKNWTPQLLPNNETTEAGVTTAPAVRGATNWYSTAYNPATGLYYVMTVEDYTVYRKANEGGFGSYSNPADPPKKLLRAFDIQTGKVAWQIDFNGPAQTNYSGVLSTAGGLVFFGESSGGIAAADARTGRRLWHFEANHPIKASPMTYAIDGRQYVAIATGGTILSFALPESP